MDFRVGQWRGGVLAILLQGRSDAFEPGCGGPAKWLSGGPFLAQPLALYDTDGAFGTSATDSCRQDAAIRFKGVGIRVAKRLIQEWTPPVERALQIGGKLPFDTKVFKAVFADKTLGGLLVKPGRTPDLVLLFHVALALESMAAGHRPPLTTIARRV